MTKIVQILGVFLLVAIMLPTIESLAKEFGIFNSEIGVNCTFLETEEEKKETEQKTNKIDEFEIVNSLRILVNTKMRSYSNQVLLFESEVREIPSPPPDHFG